MAMTEFQRFIDEEIHKAGGLRQLAKKTKVSPSTLSAWQAYENRKPDPESLIKLANAVSVPWHQLAEMVSKGKALPLGTVSDLTDLEKRIIEILRKSPIEIQKAALSFIEYHFNKESPHGESAEPSIGRSGQVAGKSNKPRRSSS